MAKRDIVYVGEPILREKSRKVEVFDNRLIELIDDMKETMLYSEGVGLAAPQVGILKRVVVISLDQENFYELINPEIIEVKGKQYNVEACLSVPNRQGKVKRPKSIKVRYFDRWGKEQLIGIEGYEAVVFCHEIDHLDGILYIDKMIKEVKE